MSTPTPTPSATRANRPPDVRTALAWINGLAMTHGGMYLALMEYVEGIEAALATAEAAGWRAGIQAAVDKLPTSWVDPLLTGGGATLHGSGGTWGCPDIERLLRAIDKRLRALTPPGAA